MYKNKEIGNKGENLACQYLEQLGYEILKRNYFDKVGEIDIVAYKDSKIHFIEVKSVSRETQYDVIHETSYNPAEKIDHKKINRMQKIAQKFLIENCLDDQATQFDLIMIFIFDRGFKYKIEVIENINLN